MTSVDRAIIERRLAGMIESLRTLEPVEAMTLEDYEADLGDYIGAIEEYVEG